MHGSRYCLRAEFLMIAALIGMIYPMKAQEARPSREEIIQAMRVAADYSAQVLLDEQGKSRCDYSLLDGTWFDYEPAWHTGQIINGLVEVYKVTNDERYLAAAKKAGDWWVSLEIKDDPRFEGMVRAVHGDGVNYIVCATVTDGTPGLFNLYRLTKEHKYADVPTRAGEWMLKHLYLPKEGLFYDRVDPATGEVMKEDDPSKREKGVRGINAIARPNNEGFLYKDMFEYTGDVRYKEIFINLCESLVRKQGPEGLWMQFAPNSEAKKSFHPRFNLWYAESLIEGYQLTGDLRYLESAKKTLVFYTKYQKKDGTFYYENYLDGRSNENSVTGSTVAMLGMLWIRLQNLDKEHDFRENIARSVRWILGNRFSSAHPDRNLAGATLNLRTRKKDGNLYLTQRDLGTAFAMRFLAAYYNDRFKEE